MITKYEECKVVSELCCNHQGNFDIAIKMIEAAKQCGADYAKFQKRNPIKAVPEHMHNQPHPCPIHAFGETYLEHRYNLEFSLEQHKEFKLFCEKIGIGYSSSVWDEDSARDIISLNPDFIKVPSAMNENYELLNILFKEYKKDIHISLGMIDKNGKEELFKYLEDKKDRIVVYWTTSAYPLNFNELFLLEILKLKEIFPRVGFSGHHLGISVDMCAYAIGATWLERHFTLDRTMRGTDQSASLEISGMQKVCRDLKAAYRALTYKNIDLTDDELKNKEKLKIKKNIVAI